MEKYWLMKFSIALIGMAVHATCLFAALHLRRGEYFLVLFRINALSHPDFLHVEKNGCGNRCIVE